MMRDVAKLGPAPRTASVWKQLALLALAGVAAIVLLGALKAHVYKGFAPTVEMRRLPAFLEQRPANDRLEVIDLGDREVLVARGPRPPLWTFPSGEAAYVFDACGDLTDWTADAGDYPQLRNVLERTGTRVSKTEALSRFSECAKAKPE